MADKREELIAKHFKNTYHSAKWPFIYEVLIDLCDGNRQEAAERLVEYEDWRSKNGALTY